MSKKNPELTDYILRDIPRDLWREVKASCALEGIPVRTLIVDFLKHRIEDAK